MKLQSITMISGVLAVTCAFQQVRSAPPSQELPGVVIQGNATRSLVPTGEVDTPKQGFSELIDIEVLNYQNERLGRIKAITADLENGKLVEVLVARGGLLGMNERITPVPPTLFSIDARHDVARINVSKARFDAAPLLPAANSAVYSQAERVAAASRYFGVQPWFGRGRELGYVQTTSALELMQIKNAQGRYMGKVGMVMMDLPTARIRQIVDDTESMDGNGSHILPTGSLHYNARRTGLVLNDTFAGLNNQPHFRWVHGNGDDTNYLEQLNTVHTMASPPAVQTTRITNVRSSTRHTTASKGDRATTPAVVVRKALPAGRPRATAHQIASE